MSGHDWQRGSKSSPRAGECVHPVGRLDNAGRRLDNQAINAPAGRDHPAGTPRPQAYSATGRAITAAAFHFDDPCHR